MRDNDVAEITLPEAAEGPSEVAKEGELHLRVLATDGQDVGLIADRLVSLAQRRKEQPLSSGQMWLSCLPGVPTSLVVRSPAQSRGYGTTRSSIIGKCRLLNVTSAAFTALADAATIESASPVPCVG